MITIAANLVLNLSLNTVYSFRGLALGTAIAANINAGLLIFLLSRRLGGIDAPRITTTFLKTCVAAAVMGLASYYAEQWLHSVFNHHSIWHRLLRVSGAIGVGLGVLALMAYVLRLEEFGAAMSRILSRFRKPPAADDAKPD